jgi:hypothetical protein
MPGRIDNYTTTRLDDDFLDWLKTYYEEQYRLAKTDELVSNRLHDITTDIRRGFLCDLAKDYLEDKVSDHYFWNVLLDTINFPLIWGMAVEWLEDFLKSEETDDEESTDTD